MGPEMTLACMSLRPTLLAGVLSALAINLLPAFEVEQASSKRFKGSYVESESVPSLSVIPKQFHGRARALRNERQAIEAGMAKEEIDEIRRLFLREMYVPIRVTDPKTGTVYEVQSNRRTTTATSKAGKILWKVNPFKDAKLKPYRVPHPFIGYIGKSTRAERAEKGDLFLAVSHLERCLSMVRHSLAHSRQALAQAIMC